MKRRNEGAETFNPYAQLFCLGWLVALLVVVGFRSDNPAYREQLAQWHQKRVESLKSENGWLNLAGLFWLKEGVNTVGSDPNNDLVFPSGKAPEKLGSLRLVNGVVTFEAAPGSVVQANGQPLLDTRTIFAADQKTPLTLAHESLRWFVIKRGSRYAIRLRDLESSFLKEFSGIDRYPVDES
jgi:uncharacterized protein